MANNPVFVYGFLTAFIWATIGAIVCFKKYRQTRSENASMALRIGGTVLVFLAFQSIFWVVGCAAWSDFSYDPVLTYAGAFHKLFSWYSWPWWLASFVSLALAVVCQVRAENKGDYDNFGGLMLAALMPFPMFGLVMLVMWVLTMAASVVSFG